MSTAGTATTLPFAPSVTVTARDHSFEVPPEIEGGVVRMTLQNSGKMKHEAVIVAAGQTPVDRLRQDLTQVVSGRGRPTPMPTVSKTRPVRLPKRSNCSPTSTAA